LFLFATFLMFAVFHAIGEPVSFDNVKVDSVAQGFGQAETALDADLAKLEADRKAALAAHKPTEGIDARIAQTKSSLGTVRALPTGSLGALAEGAGQPAARADNPVDRVWQKAKANPDLLIYKLQANAYKYSWLLIPISVPFVWLLFAWRREFGLYDHTVFVTYSLSFMMLALTIAGVGGAFGLSPLVAIPVLYAPFHLYRQLRGTYGIGRVGALVRTAFLIAFAAAALTLWALAIIAMLLEG
jgi:hypothetical protein